MTRRIPFDGIENFRDFGGYVADGGRLKTGVLYRAAHQGRASDADLTRLAELGLKVIVDLRRPNEREREPNRRWAGFAAELIENDIGQQGLDEWGAFIARSDLTVESFRNYMLDYYRDAPFQPRIIDLYRRYFRALAEGDGAVLIHCAAGKDRTGIACALTHHLMGVHSDDIVADYLLTNDTERQTARLPLIREAVREANGSVASDAALMTAMRVEAEYLDEAFAAIRSENGSPDGYIDTVLGLDGAQREAIRARLLA